MQSCRRDVQAWQEKLRIAFPPLGPPPFSNLRRSTGGKGAALRAPAWEPRGKVQSLPGVSVPQFINGVAAALTGHRMCDDPASRNWLGTNIDILNENPEKGPWAQIAMLTLCAPCPHLVPPVGSKMSHNYSLQPPLLTRATALSGSAHHVRHVP